MNTQFKLNGKAALAACLLSTAVWLPLAAQAQNSPITTGHMPATHTRMEDWSHHHAMHSLTNTGACRHPGKSPAYLPESGFGNAGAGAGFAETDPASQFIPGHPGDMRSADAQVPSTPVGFAETDPASVKPLADLAISRGVQGRMRQTLVGFAETNPAASTYRPAVDMQNRHLAVCPHVNGELTAHGDPGMMSARRLPGRG